MARSRFKVGSRMWNRHHTLVSNYDHRQDTLRLQPPLNVQKEYIDRVIEALDEAFSNHPRPCPRRRSNGFEKIVASTKVKKCRLYYGSKDLKNEFFGNLEKEGVAGDIST